MDRRVFIIGFTTFVLMLDLFFLSFSFAGEERKIPLSEVPEHVIDVVEKAVPGITLIEAATEREKGRSVYEIEGVKKGRKYEIEISNDGEMLEIETVKDGEGNAKE